ncbi:hypothetical protein AcW1_008810 [Taiwanofungus camphoratus]|nr:hypothetical protein AcV5_006839 [Antrodia cinnamomea]KAI0935209.1 hypothetical protein AcV7_003706 [Antrodia cinnamomea]KAI0949110.1 hypothetical protein AcW1_008810 [Antrodia cinnamomea]
MMLEVSERVNKALDDPHRHAALRRAVAERSVSISHIVHAISYHGAVKRFLYLKLQPIGLTGLRYSSYLLMFVRHLSLWKPYMKLLSLVLFTRDVLSGLHTLQFQPNYGIAGSRTEYPQSIFVRQVILPFTFSNKVA